MAHATVRLPVTGKWAYIDSDTPIGVIDISEKSEVYMNTWMGTAPNWKGSQLFFQVEEFPAALSKNRIYYATAKFAFRTTWRVNKYRIMNAKEDFDPETLEYSNKPALYGALTIESPQVSSSQTGQNFKDFELSPTTATAEYLSVNTCKLLKFPTHVLVQTETSSSGSVVLSTTGITKLWTLTDGVTLPYIEVTYDDSIFIGSKIKVANAPTSGYVNPRESTSFSWIYEKDTSSGYDCFGEDYGQSSATFYWKTSSDESYTSVPISGTTQGVTIPANTFPINSTIQWYVQGTDDGGTTSQTDVYSFSTSAGAVTVTLISPKSTIESNNAPITFKWSYSSPDGFTASRYELWWKLPSEASDQWHELADRTSAETSYTVPAYTFPAGEVQWLVHAYNIDGVKGSDSISSFICYGAPEAPIVNALNVPFTSVRWQASDQQAYQIRVDNVIYGPYFGTEKIFEIPNKLEDGEHRISVSVIGTYALWSEWGTSIINVQNVPGEEIVLGGTGGVDVFLSWATAEETSDFLIFRDNVQIGRTAETSFTDRYATGEHTYKVINRLSDGNYSESNEVTLDTNIDGTYISPLSGGEWLKIKYMLKSASDQEYEESVETVYNHLAGDGYPSVSISRYREKNLNYSAVFLYVDEAEHTAFKNMLRKPVVMKFENGNVIAGVIDSWTVIHRKQYYTAYTFTLRQIEFEDYTDDTT